MNKFTLLTITLLSSTLAFADTIERIGEVEANWTDEGIWSPQAPTSLDDVYLWSEVTTNLTSDASIRKLLLNLGANFNFTDGTFTITDVVNQNQSNVDIAGNASLSLKEYQFGEDTDSAMAATLDVYGNASIKTTGNGNSVRIGWNAQNYNVNANFYEDSVVTARIKVGSETSGSTATSTLNVYDRAKVNADYINFYQNATMNVYGSAIVTASNDIRLHDLTGSTSGTLNVSGSAQFTGHSFFAGDGTVITVSDSAKLTATSGTGFFYLGADYNASSSGTAHLILKDNATFQVAQNFVMLNGSTFTLEGSNLTVSLQALGGKISTSDAKIRFIADANGVSKITSRYYAYIDQTNSTGFKLDLDFSNLTLEEGIYTFDLITLTENAVREKTIIANYVKYSDELINLIKANEADSYELVADGLTLKLVYTFVPEPSTYAAIFGALALAFVAYRRRK